MFVFANPNPIRARVGDCAVRAVSILLDQSWEDTYLDLCLYGFMQCDLPSSNSVWGKYLKDKGYVRRILPDSCPFCFTVKDFTKKYNKGSYLLALDGHVVTVIDGDYYDTWDSGEEIPLYFWTKEE